MHIWTRRSAPPPARAEAWDVARDRRRRAACPRRVRARPRAARASARRASAASPRRRARARVFRQGGCVPIDAQAADASPRGGRGRPFVRGERREDGAGFSQRRVETSDRRGGRAGAGAGRRGIRRRLESAQPRRRRRRAGEAVQRADHRRRGRRVPAAGAARRAGGRAAGAAAARREDPLRRRARRRRRRRRRDVGVNIYINRGGVEAEPRTRDAAQAHRAVRHHGLQHAHARNR
mmetsp:Transcript_4417/g.18833  ORF Transcript_4417/g.18833 Transcript_4417/m.18833 type:complete len:236 (+) Transcript_4417:3-710(+)